MGQHYIPHPWFESLNEWVYLANLTRSISPSARIGVRMQSGKLSSIRVGDIDIDILGAVGQVIAPDFHVTSPVFRRVRAHIYPTDFCEQGFVVGGQCRNPKGETVWRTSVVLNEEPNIRNSRVTPLHTCMRPGFKSYTHTKSDTLMAAVSGRTYMYLTQLGYRFV